MQDYNKTLSSYWLDENDYDVLTGEKIKAGKDLFKLASYQRAVANFVKIVTGEDINVQFNSKDSSYTDGKTVVIGASTKPKDFDPNVGLALHEASHCILTDFKLWENLINGNIRFLRTQLSTQSIDSLYEIYLKELSEEKEPFTKEQFLDKTYIGRSVWYKSIEKIKDLTNYIEDRRIDLYMFRNAQGYNGYYTAMYDKYFNNKIIDKGLKSTAKRTEDWDSYMFRIVNLTNTNRDLKALKGLQEIYDLINFKNIERIKSTADSIDIAIEIFNIVEGNIVEPPSFGQQPQPQNGDGENEDDDEDTQSSGPGTPSSDGATIPGKSGGDDESGSTSPGDYDLSDKETKRLNKAQEKQKDFNDGDVRKSTVSKTDKRTLTAINESGSDTVEVGKGVEARWGRNKPHIDCLVVDRLTDTVLEGGVYDDFHKSKWTKESRYGKYAERGIVLGKVLGKKLKVRNEEKSTVFNRLRNGKIDKRMISSLGYGAEAVFKNIETSAYNPATLHISIDGSGSMSGEKFGNTIQATVAICQAAKMISGLDVEVSYRSTQNIGNVNKPAIFYLYKSKRDTIRRLLRVIESTNCCGTTPEGLCFEAILKRMTAGNAHHDSYFVNFSDGAPYFGSAGFEYAGTPAAQHTSQQVRKFEGMGIKTLGYFIQGSYTSENNQRDFKTMYGKQSKFVKVSEVTPLAKTLNQMFLR
tara:strand:+ start:1326 stop:3410 length:2085 start_codon:yes stop_codon:yes gene_type:complete